MIRRGYFFALTDRGEKRRDGSDLGHRERQGGYKYTGSFPQFVADDDRVGRWLASVLH